MIHIVKKKAGPNGLLVADSRTRIDRGALVPSTIKARIRTE